MNSETQTKRARGPFTGRQLTVIACVAVVALVVMIPTAALAAAGAFSSTTAAPAVTAANTSTATNAVGVFGRAMGAGNVPRTGVVGGGTGTKGVGVQGNGASYGVFSNGPLGVAAGKKLVCGGCVTGPDLQNRLVVPFTLDAGTDSAPITVPPNTPVSLTGVTLTSGERGVGSATLLRIPDGFIEWVGLGSPSLAGAAISDDYSAVPGSHIIDIDYGNFVAIQVNDANSIRIHNGSAGGRTGTVVLTW
jgi:hypothetical protein